MASVFAAHAAVALVTARRQEQLEGKGASRDVIGMAKGIVMARQKVSDDEAFDILRRASQRMNVKLRELAERVIHPPVIEAVEPRPARPSESRPIAAEPKLPVNVGRLARYPEHLADAQVQPSLGESQPEVSSARRSKPVWLPLRCEGQHAGLFAQEGRASPTLVVGGITAGVEGRRSGGPTGSCERSTRRFSAVER